MRAVVTRVSSASVRAEGRVVGELPAPGLLVLLGVGHSDGAEEVEWMARKVWGLRILEASPEEPRDETSRREERSASDLGAPILVVSQFTLYGDARKGRRPSWTAAAPGEVSEPLYDSFCTALESLGAHVERGVFGAHMEVASVNDGPVTLLLESP